MQSIPSLAEQPIPAASTICRLITASAHAAPIESQVPCDGPNGAQPRTSQALAQLLTVSSAHDLADPAPEQLPTLLGDTEIDAETFFPPGRSVVTFRYRDATGNIGRQDAAVEVGNDGICG